MANGFGNSIPLGQFGEGIHDLAQGLKTNDADNTANSIAQVLTGVQTALSPIGDFTGIVNLRAAAITAAKIVRDFNDPNKTVDPLDILAVAGNTASLAIALGKNHPALRAVNVNLGVALVVFGSAFSGSTNGAVDPTTNTRFQDAQNWIAPRNPLVLDQDNDGIEAVGVNPAAPVLFDMDGDGIKTATGWIKADDGMLVLDRNGNGLIDSGRELFGDSTVLTRGPRAGKTAANGYEALADLDINADGAINSADAAYASLRIWQDANQDGISQAGELRTLSSLGIASLKVAGQASNINLGNGNTQPFSGSFTRTNGSTGASGVAEVSGSLLLASNNFYREFTDNPALTTAAKAPPQMRGSGVVRDLQGVGTTEKQKCRKINRYENRIFLHVISLDRRAEA